MVTEPSKVATGLALMPGGLVLITTEAKALLMPEKGLVSSIPGGVSEVREGYKDLFLSL